MVVSLFVHWCVIGHVRVRLAPSSAQARQLWPLVVVVIMSDSFVQASCASAAAVFSTSCLYPLEICKARLVTSVGPDAKQQTSVAILASILRKDGPLGLYKGLSTKSLHAVVQTFGYYYIYTFLARTIKRTSGRSHLGTLTNLGVGYLAGVGNLAASLPFEVRMYCIAVLCHTGCRLLAGLLTCPSWLVRVCQVITMQTQISSEKRSLLQTVTDLYVLDESVPCRVGLASPFCVRGFRARSYNDGGTSAFYRGLNAAVLLCINPAIYNTVFDQLKGRLLARIQARSTGKKVVALTTLQAFVLGIIAKAIATVLTFPYIRTKMVMQATSHRHHDKPSGDGCDEEKGMDNEERPDLSEMVCGLDFVSHCVSDCVLMLGVHRLPLV